MPKRTDQLRGKLLKRSFFQAPPEHVAPRLLGKVLAHRTRSGWLAGRIVEVEAYLGPHNATPDPAAHSHRGPNAAERSPVRAARARVCLLHLWPLLLHELLLRGRRSGRRHPPARARAVGRHRTNGSPSRLAARRRAMRPHRRPRPIVRGPRDHSRSPRRPRSPRSGFTSSGPRRWIPRHARARHAAHRHPPCRGAAAALLAPRSRMCVGAEKNGRQTHLSSCARPSVRAARLDCYRERTGVSRTGPQSRPPKRVPRKTSIERNPPVKLTSLLSPAAAVAIMTVAVLASTSGVQATQDQPPAAQAPPAGAPPGNAMAPGGQPMHSLPAPTNLQVLPKDLTAMQVREIMGGWAGSLGVHCDFCHAADATKKMPNGRPMLNFADDSKDDKKIARIMYRDDRADQRRLHQQGQDARSGLDGNDSDMRNLPSRPSKCPKNSSFQKMGGPPAAAAPAGGAPPAAAPPPANKSELEPASHGRADRRAECASSAGLAAVSASTTPKAGPPTADILKIRQGDGAGRR